MSTRTTYSWKWAYTVTPNGWVLHVTHLSSMATYWANMPLAKVIELDRKNALLANVATVDDFCKACGKPYAEYRTYHFCRPCLAVAPNYKEGSL